MNWRSSGKWGENIEAYLHIFPPKELELENMARGAKIVNCILYMPQFATVSCLTIDKGWRYSSFSCGLIFWGVEEYGTDITMSSK